MPSARADYSVVQAAPGHGEPLNVWVTTGSSPNESDEPFPNALLKGNIVKSEPFPDAEDDLTKAFLPILTVREIRMMQFMNSVTDGAGWQEQVFKKEVVLKWREETVPPNAQNTTNVTNELFDSCIQELQHKARGIYQNPVTPLVVYNGDVVKADLAVSESTKLALQEAVKPLEDIPDQEKDWCPVSDGLIRNIVDPSLFPLVYGKTRALKVGEKVVGVEDCIERSGAGEVLKKNSKGLDENYFGETFNSMKPFSLEFQWLPCEVNVEGDKARITSYINNLHPKHSALYAAIEDVINAAIPLWQATLAPLYGDFRWGEPQFFRRIPRCTEVSYAEDGNLVQPQGNRFDARAFKLALPESVSFKDLYGKQGKPLQIIVKMFNFELTPEKGKYEGEAWHIEGMANECICATATYCYSSANVKSPHLAFQQLVDGSSFEEEFENELGEHGFLAEYFGCSRDRGGIQDVGSIELKEGRLIAFPNLLLHQIQPFELEDATRPGHVKLLHMFLVDPNVRIVSTADVPVQRKDWWRERVMERVALGDQSGVQGLGGLPIELKDLVFNGVEEFPMSLEDAKKSRKDLLEERKQYVLDHADVVHDCNNFYLPD